jgi:NADH-quinone oxidoreductase subunit B
MEGYYQKLGENVLVTTLDQALNWSRENSLWLFTFGLACCAIEMMQTSGPRSEVERCGMAPRATPRQADLMLVAGTLTYKMAIRTKLLYEQMAEPRYVISMGSCANSGGLFTPSYSVLKGVDQILPVDVYVPGCPPRPEALVEGIFKLRDKVRSQHHMRRPETPQPVLSAEENPAAIAKDFSKDSYPNLKTT